MVFNYLTGWRQKVVLDGHSSSLTPIPTGVLQECILGALLSSIYMNPLTNIPLTSGSKVILYTDDIVLYRPIDSQSDIAVLQQDIHAVATWVKDWPSTFLKLKPWFFSRKHSPPSLSVFIQSTPICGNSLGTRLPMCCTLYQVPWGHRVKPPKM